MSQIIKHEAQNLTIGQREVDGYINATALCQAAGKKWADYARLKTTQEFFDALASELSLETITKPRDMGIPTSALVETSKGGKEEQGTWVHPQVATHLAMWLSPQFSVLVTRWVVDWMTGKQTPPAPQPEQKTLPWTPPPLYPNMTEATFKALPAADQDYFAETPAERTERIRRESREIWRQ